MRGDTGHFLFAAHWHRWAGDLVKLRPAEILAVLPLDGSMNEIDSNTQSGEETPALDTGARVPFRVAHPQVTFLEVEVRAVPMGFGPIELSRYSLEKPPGQLTQCPNPNCAEGGFDIGMFLTELIGKKKTSGEAGARCMGSERFGRKARGACLYSFSAKARIGYDNSAVSSQD